MRSPQEIAFVIKQEIKKNDFSQSEMLANLEMNVNTISDIAKGKEISYARLAKIADYLNVSVDYLLGRESNAFNNVNTQNSITKDSFNNGNITLNNSSVSDVGISEETREIEKIMSTLTYKERVKLMNKIYEFEEECKKK